MQKAVKGMVKNDAFVFKTRLNNEIFDSKDVPEVLNVHMNEIYKKLTRIKSNKLKF